MRLTNATDDLSENDPFEQRQMQSPSRRKRRILYSSSDESFLAGVSAMMTGPHEDNMTINCEEVSFNQAEPEKKKKKKSKRTKKLSHNKRIPFNNTCYVQYVLQK